MTAAASDVSAATEPPAIMPLGRRIAILTAVVMATTLYSVSILVASTVLPQLQGAMSATADEISWIMTFNILATAVVTPMTGWLVASFGRRNVMVGGVGLFAISTYFCGAATSLEMLVAARIVQGAAGAPVLPLAQAIILDVFPRHQHGVVLSVYGMGVVVGQVIGPAYGGFLAEIYSWRWAFYMIVPLAAVAGITLWLVLAGETARQKTRLDWTGFLSLAVAVACLQLVLSRGARLDWFDAFEIQLETLVGILAFYLFIAHSLTSKQPFLTLSLLLNRNYALGLVIVSLYGMINFTPMVLLPPLLRTYSGFPDSLIGQIISFRGMGAIAGFFAVMFVRNLDPRIPLLIGFGLQVGSGLWLMSVDLNVDVTTLSINAFLQGLAVGAIFAPLTSVTFSTMESKHLPETVAMYHFMRNIGSSLFISICFAEIVRTTGVNYANMSQAVSPYNEALTMPWVLGGWGVGDLVSLSQLSAEIKRQSAMIGYLNAFGLFTAVSALAVPLVLLVKRRSA